MRLLLALSVALVTALPSCSAEQRRPADGHVCVAPDFRPDEAAAIGTAVDEWNVRGGTRMALEAGDADCDLTFTKVPADALPTRRCAQTGLDLTEVAPCGLAHLDQIALHELGHYLTGPGHSTNPVDVMFADWTPAMSPALTDADLARLRSVR